MSSFLRKLQTGDTCPIANDINIDQNGTYIITDQQNIEINASGDVYLDFKSVGNYSYIISPENIIPDQNIVVYGFNSEVISNNISCSSTASNEKVQPYDVVTVAITLVIDLVSFGIEALPYIVFIPAEPSPLSESVVKTIIQLDSGQLLTLYNVSQDSLTSENFIFADSDNSNNDNSNEDLYIGLGAGLGGGLLLMSAIGYMYYNGIGLFSQNIDVQV